MSGQWQFYCTSALSFYLYTLALRPFLCLLNIGVTLQSGLYSAHEVQGRRAPQKTAPGAQGQRASLFHPLFPRMERLQDRTCINQPHTSHSLSEYSLSIRVQKTTPLTTDHTLLMCTASLSLKSSHMYLLIEAILLNFIFMCRFDIKGRV